MKEIIIIIFLILLIKFDSLSSDTTSTKFMPLKIGNTWSYNYYNWIPPGPATQWRVKGTVTKDTLIGEHKYFFISNGAFLTNSADPCWVRIDSTDGKLIWLNSTLCPGSNFRTIDSLAASLNNYCRYCLSDTAGRILFSINSSIVFEVSSLDKRYLGYPYSPMSIDRTFSKFFGLTSAVYGYFYPNQITLLGCVIDGILYGDTNTLTGIQQISNYISRIYSLHQNYPNPFNPTTKISFSIPLSRGVSADGGRGVLVKLKIFDILGREVSTLVNESLKPGTYEVDWNGSSFASGVYFYKLISGDYIESKKMILIR